LFCGSHGVLKILAQRWFFDHTIFIGPFWIYRFECLYIIREYTYGENFKPFGCVLREMRIWNFNFSLKINLFWNWYLLSVIMNRAETLKRCGDVFLICVLKFEVVWKCWKEIWSHFVFGSQFEVNSKVCQDFLFEKAKWFKDLKIESKHIFPCYNQFLHIQIDMWMVEVWEVVSVGNLHQNGFLNKSL
jgi:hypothetical protein